MSIEIVTTQHLLLLALPLLLITKLLRNCLKHPSIAGPFFAGATDIWRAYHQYRGQLRQKLISLHATHGPIVRYGVKDISISDPSAINIIYGSRAGFVTAESYQVLIGISNGKEVPSLVSTADESKHDYEVPIDATIPSLVQALERHNVVDLAELMLFYSMDAATKLSSGEYLGCLESESDIGGTIRLIRDRFEHWGWWSSLPGLERLVFRNWWAMGRQRVPSSMAAKAVSLLKTRTSNPKAMENAHPDLLTKFIQASHDSPETLDTTGIISLLMSTISGAGDTTATTLTAILYNVITHPDTLRNLRKELQTADLHPPYPYAALSKLPYLTAVIKESMRVFSTLTFPIERKVPAGGALIAGHFWEEGTTVGVLPAAVHLDKDTFGDDAGVFRPERWLQLEGDEESVRKMEAASMGFSRGRRVCLGQWVAGMGMRKVVAELVTKFEFELVDREVALEADFSAAVAVLRPLWVRVRQRI